MYKPARIHGISETDVVPSTNIVCSEHRVTAIVLVHHTPHGGVGTCSLLPVRLSLHLW